LPRHVPGSKYFADPALNACLVILILNLNQREMIENFTDVEAPNPDCQPKLDIKNVIG